MFTIIDFCLIIIIIILAEMCDWLEPREEYLSTLGLHNTEVSFWKCARNGIVIVASLHCSFRA